ncbi:toxin-antitoxin system YwqK family antitoxin [Flaviaesturariibacter aridisoli]|uniref:TonB C-terminal domain-containing protein n=1 Tax=Flaviaesturariibacter aridisoli TaxID=2545761 RepID=A0A4V2WN21_9BACT|nr:hypothetical protein [Flaviaesturariibacter aridisoli]TCZ73852.1 hypothetical protein E0486_04000 [Flaviaesturariibacter aridisoli]
MNRQLLILLLALGSSLTSGAQELRTFHFNEQMQVVSDSTAPITGVGRQQGEHWELLLLDAASGNKILHGFFDSSLQVLDGPCTFFHDNGVKSQQGYYIHSQEAGWWRYWNEDSQRTDSILYENGAPRATYTWEYAASGYLLRFSGTDTAGRKENRTYSPEGVVLFESSIEGKAAEMRGYAATGALEYEYISDASGKVLKDTRSAYIKKKMEEAGASQGNGEPEYIGGRRAFNEYLFGALHYRADNLKSETDTYNITIRIEFDLTEKGVAKNIRTSDLPDPIIFQRIQGALRRMSPWDMKGHKSFHIVLSVTL